VYLEPVRKQRPPEDDPSVGLRLGVLAVVAIILFSVLGFRLWFLQILTGDHYVALADNNRLRTVSIEAPRGVVYDRDGEVLVTNRGGLSVGILPMDLHDEDRVIPRLALVLQMQPQEVWKKLQKARQDPYRVTVIKEDVPLQPVVQYLKEHSLEFPGVRVETSFLRSYPRLAFAAHVVGYVGEVSERELQEEQFRTLKPGDQVGKEGVELVYDRYLRGVDGMRSVEVDAAGRPKRNMKYIKPTPGQNLVLTIDNVVQEAAERAIVEGLELARKDGFKAAAAGAVVALDPKTGQILAMTSYPDYDPSLWAGGIPQKDLDRLNAKEAHQPQLNRAIKGLYPAASTFKPFVAATALNHDLVTGETKFEDPGNFRIGQQVWNCWNKEGHGEVNMIEALMESCDTYFYNLGRMFYEQTGPILQDGLRRFGFDRPTGVDLPHEYRGRVPDKEWKKATGQNAIDRIWKTGDDINLAIGQGDLLVTPLQLATAFAAIANARTVTDKDGKTQVAQLDLLVPHLGLRITDGAGNTIHEFETQKKGEVFIDPADLEVIRKGLLYVTSEQEGTANDAFEGFPVPVVGKTGTAQKLPEDDYAWFMGYAPANDPKILVVALVEQGGHGSSVAAPVVRRVLEKFFNIERQEGDQPDIEVTE